MENKENKMELRENGRGFASLWLGRNTYWRNRAVGSCTITITAKSYGIITFYYPRDAMLARVVATATCPSVCLSVCPDVCHTPVLCLAERKQDREMYTV